MHKLTQRISAWRSFKKKSLPWNDLPAEFREVKGFADPPHAEYSYLTELDDIVASYISPEMKNTMFNLMLAEKMTVARQLTPNHRE